LFFFFFCDIAWLAGLLLLQLAGQNTTTRG